MKTYPIYYKYGGDGYNNWRVLVETSKDVLVGTTRVYPSGLLLDPCNAGGFYRADPAWTTLTLAEAVALTAR